MSENQAGNDTNTDLDDRRDRKFAVSTNRGKANHRVRYVETGGANVNIDECTFCEAMPNLSDEDREQTEEKGE